MTQGKYDLKEKLLQQFDAAYAQLLTAAIAASARGITRQGGRWGPCEVLAHIVGWNVEATERIPRILAGEPSLQYDDDAFNAAIITVLDHVPFSVVLDKLQQTHEWYIQMLRVQDEQVYTSDNPVIRRIQAAIQHHYEHTQALDELV